MTANAWDNPQHLDPDDDINVEDILASLESLLFRESHREQMKHSHKCKACGHIFCHSSAEAALQENAHNCPKCFAGPFYWKHKLESELSPESCGTFEAI